MQNEGGIHMPMIEGAGCRINVQVEGREDDPVLMLSNSIAADLTMWDPQVADFARHFRLIRYDRRGHGKSDVPPAPYSMEIMGRDVLAVLDALGIKSINWCGLSMGGMVGQWLGANAPDRIEKLILCDTHYYYADKQPWNDRVKAAREKGMAALGPAFMERWFTKSFRESDPHAVAKIQMVLAATPVEGFAGCCMAGRDMDHRDLLGRIKAPTLVLTGRQDSATPLQANQEISEKIPGARLVVIEDASHLSNIAQPQAFTKAVMDFLTPK
jgi:3-oxoadipate enol-lactonase